MNAYHSFSLFILLVTTLAQPVVAQQPREAVVTKPNDTSQKDSSGTPPGNQTFLTASFVMTSGLTGGTGYPNPLGFEFEFLVRPTKRDKSTRYYFGINGSVNGTSSNTPFNIPGALNGTLETTFTTMFVGLSQYYFFPSKSSTKLFLSLDLGVRSILNVVRTHYEFINPILPFPGGYTVADITGSQFSAGLKIGYFFQVVGKRGFFVKTGVATGGDFEVCKYGSVTIQGNGQYQYELGTTNAVFVTISLGLLL